MRKDRVAAIENFKEYARGVIQAFQDGAGNIDAPFTADLATAAIWRKADQVLLETFPKELRGTIHLRASGESLSAVGGISYVSCRCLGARKEGHPNVFYVVAKASTMAEARGIIAEFRNAGLDVRDWEFYA
jgi:hypothetical protein